MIIKQIKRSNEAQVSRPSSLQEDKLNERMLLDTYYKDIYEKAAQLEKWLKLQGIIDKNSRFFDEDV